METMSAKPSGLPRPSSRLPVLNKRSSQIFKQPSEIPENYRPAAATPKLQKRASLAGLARAAHQDLEKAPPVPKDHKENNVAKSRPTVITSTSRYGIKPPTGTSGCLARPSSRGNQQRIPPPPVPKAPVTEDGENHDRLSSLDSFRSASRQGYSDDSSPLEPELLSEETFRPRDRTKSRPSLSERTIESLQAVPSTPKNRRRSSFFSPIESPMGPPARPASAMSKNGSRPGTSDGPVFAQSVARAPSPVKRPALPKPAGGGFGFTPTSASAKRRSVSTALSGLRAPNGSYTPRRGLPRSPSPSETQSGRTPVAKSLVRSVTAGSKTVAARPSKSKPSLKDAFEAPAPVAPKPSLAPAKKTGSSNASSAALREQIAAAKAAARKERVKAKVNSPQQNGGATFEPFGSTMSDMTLHSDPFNQAPKDEKHVVHNCIKKAWVEGILNISNIGLKEIPNEVLDMFTTQAMGEGKVNWAEVVDLRKLIAAGNEIEAIPERMFPAILDEDTETPFLGLELIDLHANALLALPSGLGRLEILTNLNLSHNKLDNDVLSTVSSIASLRELRLAHNNLSGHLSSDLCTNIADLEVLDLQANRLLSLPESIRSLTNLRTLNVSGNQLTALPMEALQLLPLTDLDASNNALIASLFPLGGSSGAGHTTLKSLNISNNSLAALTFDSIPSFLKLEHLDVSNNHFTSLPSLSSWGNLVTLLASDNKLAAIPDGFVTLENLVSAELNGNEIRVLDPELARMKRLERLGIQANPLREKKFLGMDWRGVKRSLAVRLEELDDGVSDPETVIGPEG